MLPPEDGFCELGELDGLGDDDDEGADSLAGVEDD